VLSKDPLTAEQIAVYRAILANYTKGVDAALNISNVTDPFGESSNFSHGCPKDTSEHSPSSSPQIVHRLDPTVLLNSKMVLVDPHQQAELVKENDPQNLIMGAIDNHQPVNDSDLSKSVQTAFSTGLFTFSEIVFNKKHTQATLQYGFVCGGLCGSGSTVVLKKVHGNWEIGKVCSFWMS
jgi:hypothetical protein